MELEELARELGALKERVEQLEAENEALRTTGTPPAQPSSGQPLSRRGVLRKSAGVVGAGVGMALAANLATSRPARGAAGDPLLAGRTNVAGASSTLLSSSATSSTLRLTNSATGKALHATSSSAAAILASCSSTQPSIDGLKEGNGVAIIGRITSSTSTAPAVTAQTLGPGFGIYGASSRGRGGLMEGRLAQLRLKPGLDPTHPASGLAGDLYVDSANRFWYCKGGASWAKLA